MCPGRLMPNINIYRSSSSCIISLALFLWFVQGQEKHPKPVHNLARVESARKSKPYSDNAYGCNKTLAKIGPALTIKKEEQKEEKEKGRIVTNRGN